MIGVLVITRGNFGEKILETAVDLLGHQENIYAFPFYPDNEPERLRESIIKKIHEWNNLEGVLLITEMCGGTPCNIALSVSEELEKENIKCEIVSGLNLYMIISVLNKRDNLSLEELVNQAINDGRKNIVDVKEFFTRKKERTE